MIFFDAQTVVCLFLGVVAEVGICHTFCDILPAFVCLSIDKKLELALFLPVFQLKHELADERGSFYSWLYLKAKRVHLKPGTNPNIYNQILSVLTKKIFQKYQQIICSASTKLLLTQLVSSLYRFAEKVLRAKSFTAHDNSFI